jgi:hypothetical protein
LERIERIAKMNDVALEKKIRKIADELRLSGEFTDSRFMVLKAEMDLLKLEIAALARFLEREIPSFRRDFPLLRGQVFQEIDPEGEGVA